MKIIEKIRDEKPNVDKYYFYEKEEAMGLIKKRSNELEDDLIGTNEGYREVRRILDWLYNHGIVLSEIKLWENQ